jgi:hypothetical protein
VGELSIIDLSNDRVCSREIVASISALIEKEETILTYEAKF